MKIPLQTFPVSAGLLDPRHVQAIGRAVWVYLWFLNRVTRDEQRGDDDFVGIVLNGRPLSIDEIAEELGFDYHACRRHLARLVKTGYVERRKTGAGMFSYSVNKSKKWAWKRQTSGARNRPSSSSEKQANLFPPTEAPTERKMLSGSEDPQSKICSQGTDPQSRKCNSTEQNPHAGRKRTRARSQETTKVSQGEPPLRPELRKLTETLIAVCSLINTNSNLKLIEASIVAEADYLGCSIQEAAEAISGYVLRDRKRLIEIDRWYFEDAKWRNRSKSSAAAPPLYGEAGKEMQRQQAAGR